MRAVRGVVVDWPELFRRAGVTQFPDDAALAEIEAHAAGAARRAGAVLAERFGEPLRVEFKDGRKTDPVTPVDREVQRQIAEGISERFPEHGIVGEEDPEDDATVRELTWVLDPLDGTTNFISGLPLYASSVGVLHRGRPVAGAVFLPWPCPEGGVVLHARRGGGAFRDGEPLGPAGETGREGSAIAGMPGSFASVYRFRKAARERVGEPRVMGSIVYELGLVALGALDYSVVNAPRLWDVAAGVLLIAGDGRTGGAREARPGSRASAGPDELGALGGSRNAVRGGRHQARGASPLVDAAGGGTSRRGPVRHLAAAAPAIGGSI